MPVLTTDPTSHFGALISECMDLKLRFVSLNAVENTFSTWHSQEYNVRTGG